MKDKRHEMICELKKFAKELGKTPTRKETISKSKISDYSIIKYFSSFDDFLSAAGMIPEQKSLSKNERKLIREYKSLCSKTEKIHGFFRHTLDLNEMFQIAGNPQSLKVVVQPDTHVKFVDRKAWNAFLKFLKYYNPDTHLMLGDFVDCEGLSHWPQDDLEPRRIVPEMKAARVMLQQLVDHTPGCTSRFFLTGNHEHWIDIAFTKMPELFDGLAELDIEISIKSLLALDKFGYEIFPLNHLVKIGHAHFTHGIYTGSAHAKKHLSVFKTNIYYGHLHDGQEHNETSVDGPMEAASLGCLCRLDAKFLKGRPNNWIHSFGVFEFFPDGTYTFFKPKIINGKFSFNGQIFDGE